MNVWAWTKRELTALGWEHWRIKYFIGRAVQRSKRLNKDVDIVLKSAVLAEKRKQEDNP